MRFVSRGLEYCGTVASDLKRDGMFLEVSAALGDELLLEVFYSDQTREMMFTSHRADIPFEVVDWAVTIAKRRLVPVAERE